MPRVELFAIAVFVAAVEVEEKIGVVVGSAGCRRVPARTGNWAESTQEQVPKGNEPDEDQYIYQSNLLPKGERSGYVNPAAGELARRGG